MIKIELRRENLGGGTPSSRRHVIPHQFVLSAVADTAAQTFDLEKAYIILLMEKMEQRRLWADRTNYKADGGNWVNGGNSVTRSLSQIARTIFHRPPVIGCEVIAADYPDHERGVGPSMLGPHLHDFAEQLRCEAPDLIVLEENLRYEKSRGASHRRHAEAAPLHNLKVG